MKHKSMLVIQFILLITAIVLISSCAGANENKSYQASSESVFNAERLKKYVIVRPDNAEQYEIDLSVKLRDMIKEKYGVELELKTDWIIRGEDEDPRACEILVGKTNRSVSEDAYNKFSDGFTYAIAYDGCKIALCGDNQVSLAYSLVLFELNYMKEDQITVAKDTQIINTMTEGEITYMREQGGVSNFAGLQDVLDENDKTHGKYKLIFSEEFDKAEINTKIWNYEYGYIANNELQCYNGSDKNSYIESECLVIEAQKEQMNGFEYTSARLNTKGKFSFKYGYIEMRAILPEGQGIWPAFWMMGNSGSWPECGEIDIMEMIGGQNREDTVHGTVHWGSSNPYNHMSYGLSTVSEDDLSEGFHTYAVEWDESTIKWYLDGKQFCVIDISGEQFSMFRQEFYILVNLAVGGDWPGSPNASTVFPQKYVIDYIRVYQ